MKYEMKEDCIIFDTSTSQLKTIEDFLEYYKQSKKNKYLLITNKQLLLDNQVVKNIHQEIQKKSLTLLLPKTEIDWVSSEKPCQVVYEDAFLYIVHKEPGCIIHGEPNDTTCLNAQASCYQRLHDILTPVRPIHRLDKDTTGLVLYSKIPFFQPWFDEQLSQKKIKRIYWAISYGKMEVGQKITCHKRIGKDRHHSNQYRISSTGVEACTHITCIAKKGPYCLLQCELETGRTHQIRLHLSSLGLPIVNDPIYGRPSENFETMGLWAKQIIFKNPVTNKKHKIDDFQNKVYTYFNV